MHEPTSLAALMTTTRYAGTGMTTHIPGRACWKSPEAVGLDANQDNLYPTWLT